LKTKKSVKELPHHLQALVASSLSLMPTGAMKDDAQVPAHRLSFSPGFKNVTLARLSR
jgi:hypothetical protein